MTTYGHLPSNSKSKAMSTEPTAPTDALSAFTALTDAQALEREWLLQDEINDYANWLEQKVASLRERVATLEKLFIDRGRDYGDLPEIATLRKAQEPK